MTNIADPSGHTLWEGAPQTLTAVATSGKVQGTRYRLTPFTLYIDRGLVRTDSQQIALSLVFDVDVKQSMTQKARGIGDVLVHVNHGSGSETITLEAIKDPKQVRDLINQTVTKAKQHFVEQGRSQVTVGQTPSPMPAAPPQAASGASVVEQLKELASLRDAGVLTEEEFAAQKARILG